MLQDPEDQVDYQAIYRKINLLIQLKLQQNKDEQKTNHLHHYPWLRHRQ